MPDWQELVRLRLSGLALNAAEKEEVHAELAAHLEDSYEAFRTEGLREHDAVQRTLAKVTDWKEVQRKIAFTRLRKDAMTNRVTQLWLPGLLTFALSMGLANCEQLKRSVTIRSVTSLYGAPNALRQRRMHQRRDIF